jgi:hypothetical protein
MFHASSGSEPSRLHDEQQVTAAACNVVSAATAAARMSRSRAAASFFVAEVAMASNRTATGWLGVARTTSAAAVPSVGRRSARAISR